jgi:ribonuclease HII
MKTKWIVGIDEAGRGPLAGPVSVGIFAINKNFDIKILNSIKDSKKLSEKKREEWHEKLKKSENSKYSVTYGTAKKIDKKGIVCAIKDAISAGLKKLDIKPDECEILLDGSLSAPETFKKQKTIIKGDVTEPVISAAAIFAKVERDKKMKKLAKKIPIYAFEKHKGYGTKKHIELIKKHGLSEAHRKSFCKNITVE